MTHPIYSREQLSSFKRSQLWAICDQLGLPKHSSNAKCVEEIQALQEQQIEKVDEQAVAQAELNQHIEEQAQVVAPEVNFIDIDGFYNYEAQVNGEVIATITHDCADFVTQRWVVMVGQAEVHRADTCAKCEEYIRWHYKQGTLPKCQMEVSDTGNAVIAQLTESCDQAEIDAVPDSDFGNLYRVWQGMRLIGTFYQSMSGEWVARSTNSTEVWYCSRAEEAQSRIIETDASDTTQTTDEEIPRMLHENIIITELLDKPFDELTLCEWRVLQDYESQVELVAA